MWPQTKHYVARVAWKYLFTSFWVRKGYLSISLSEKQSIHVSLIMMMIFCAVNCSFNRGRAKKKSNFFPTVARKSSSQPCCEPGLSSSAGPPPLSLSHWLQFDLGRPPLLLLWQVYFNNAGGTGCVGIAGGELWDCGDVGRVCVWWRECVPAFTATVYSSWGKREGPLLLTQGNHHHQNCNFCSPMIPLTHHWSWLITPLQLLFPCICLRGSWPLSFLFLTLPCPPTHVLLIGRTKVLQP